jgi:hypothetical protein
VTGVGWVGPWRRGALSRFAARLKGERDRPGSILRLRALCLPGTLPSLPLLGSVFCYSLYPVSFFSLLQTS